VNTLKKYDISIYGLEDREYSYEFTGSKAFFDVFSDELTGNFNAKVRLTKTALMLQVKFDIAADMNLICDRTLEPYDESFVSNEKYFFKFGEESNQDYSDEMEVIEFGTQTINIAQHLYDFIALAVPLKRIHPSLRTDDDSEDDILVYSSDKSVEIAKTTEEIIDPRWEALKKLK
jgi:uncharacterized metal-binding protein YceD (DUF177 family)